MQMIMFDDERAFVSSHFIIYVRVGVEMVGIDMDTNQKMTPLSLKERRGDDSLNCISVF